MAGDSMYFQPGLQPNSEQKADEMHVSPSYRQYDVIRSQIISSKYYRLADALIYIKSNHDRYRFINLPTLYSANPIIEYVSPRAAQRKRGIVEFV